MLKASCLIRKNIKYNLQKKDAGTFYCSSSSVQYALEAFGKTKITDPAKLEGKILFSDYKNNIL